MEQKWDIKERLKKAKMTQQQLADKLEIPKRTIEEWSAGKRTPPEYVKKMINEKLAEFEKIKRTEEEEVP